MYLQLSMVTVTFRNRIVSDGGSIKKGGFSGDPPPPTKRKRIDENRPNQMKNVTRRNSDYKYEFDISHTWFRWVQKCNIAP